MISSWVYYNPHPQDKLVGDCVKRALTAATGMDYRDVKIELNRIKRELNEDSFNSKRVYETFLKRHGFIKVPIKAIKGSKRGTVEELCSKVDSDEIVVCCVAHHLVTIKNNRFWDTWNSGYKSLYCTWRKRQ